MPVVPIFSAPNTWVVVVKIFAVSVELKYPIPIIILYNPLPCAVSNQPVASIYALANFELIYVISVLYVNAVLSFVISVKKYKMFFT